MHAAISSFHSTLFLFKFLCCLNHHLSSSDGAGISTKTLSDLVASIEFINANGEIQTVDDPDQLQSVAGCFGMLGIVTSLTMKLDPQTYARMIPENKPIALTIPPPKGFDVPSKCLLHSELFIHILVCIANFNLL